MKILRKKITVLWWHHCVSLFLLQTEHRWRVRRYRIPCPRVATTYLSSYRPTLLNPLAKKTSRGVVFGVSWLISCHSGEI